VTSLIVPARAVLKATPRTRIIQPDVRGQPFVFHAGQAVFAGLAESSVRRPYSIACSPGQAARSGAIELLVQIDDHQAPDPHLERAAPGTLLRVEGPFGSFGLPSPLLERHLLLIAGGTGIAPLRSILWDTLERESGVSIRVIYSARSAEEFAYWDELTTLAGDRRIRLASTVTRDSVAPWSGSRGRISESLIASMLDDVETRCVICGPAGLVTTTTALLKQSGVSGSRIQTETYGGEA
jgi:ferredoxin-NADP reductase